jgi:hypothetical protein
MSYVLLIGNVVDGITPVGNFTNTEEAIDYAEIFCKNEDWIVTKILEPNPAWQASPKHS